MNKTNLVIGLGQIGTAIKSILECHGIDKETMIAGPKFDVIHICFPWSDEFIEQVKYYQNEYKPTLTIIHSTVPIGISKQLDAIHSPCRGVHPLLEEGIRTFVKYFGGEKSEEAAEIFREKGIQVLAIENSDATEALKLLDTLQYGLNIMIEKEIYKFCEQKGVNPDIVYKMANRDYNEGYMKLGRPEVVRPYLNHVDGPIGGHCILPNAKIMEEFWLANLLLMQNEDYKLDDMTLGEYQKMHDKKIEDLQAKIASGEFTVPEQYGNENIRN